MPYWQLFYHLVWATKNRQPLLTTSVAPVIHSHLRTRAAELGGTVFAVEGLTDHVHMAVAIPPRIAVATFVGQVKSSSSGRFNRDHGRSFAWQEEYGVFTFDRRRLANVIAYVENQPQHHARGATIPILERASGQALQLLRELDAAYYVESEAWRREMLALDTAFLD